MQLSDYNGTRRALGKAGWPCETVVREPMRRTDAWYAAGVGCGCAAHSARRRSARGGRVSTLQIL